MKNLEQQFSEDLSITPSLNSVREHSVSIPVDLLIDIFSRVPARSIARFRCVSKFWESILGRSDFTELFLTKSLTRPRFFFTVELNDELVTFSSPQPQNPDDNSSLIATRYKYFPDYSPTRSTRTSAPLRGLVFLQRGKKVRVIFNTITGESITLPKVKATGIRKTFFGFDPISKQFKVLCMTWSRYGTPNTHRILTLETGKRLWRTIQDPILPHYVCSNEICINGVLYYQADRSKILCFDFRFEKFSFIKLDEEMNPRLTLTLFNYKGKLGAHQYIDDQWGIRLREKIALWVLEDTGKHRWSKRICQLPPLWGNIAYYMFVGMTGTGEIVLSPNACYPSNPFCIFYYNIERNTVTRINIQGFEALEHHCTFVHIFLDYVENLKVM